MQPHSAVMFGLQYTFPYFATKDFSILIPTLLVEGPVKSLSKGG